MIAERAGQRSEISKPAWFGELNGLNADPTGKRLVLTGWNTGTYDTLAVAVAGVDGGAPVFWTRSYAEGGGARFLNDGSVLFQYRPTQESMALVQLRGPARRGASSRGRGECFG